MITDTKKLFEQLKELALDLLWSWGHYKKTVWEKLDPVMWNLTRNPWNILMTVPNDRLEIVAKDPEFHEILQSLLLEKKQKETAKTWFPSLYSKKPLSCLAYFSMEYMLSEALPIYSGGLGNVAGDQLKAASDLGVPVVAVGLLYQQGYFRQMLDQEGRQQAYYPFNDPGQLPITPLRRPNGEWLRIQFAFPGYSIWIRVWEVKVGNVSLYLLDTNDPSNFPPYRTITNQLYGEGKELRLMQEMVLGIGGWRLIQELGLKPEVCHLNEGHAAFLILERARCYMEAHGVSFFTALETTRVGNLFTTHTAVPAAFDRFSPELMEQYLGRYIRNKIGIDFERFLALGRENGNLSSELFNMGYLAVRGSGAVNGVSQLHGEVSQSIFQSLFPSWPRTQVPVGSVTNGIHVPSWDSYYADQLWERACGKERWFGTTEKIEEKIRQIPDEDIWRMRSQSRNMLIEYARERYRSQLVMHNASQKEIDAVNTLFEPHILTLGFARRFATYKRPNLLLSDRERLAKLLTHTQYPVQLLIAGKAYPTDEPGKAMIKEWMDFIQDYRNDARVIFLADYDMLLTEKLVQGVDVWINTPRRPWEACGTSGMKILANGGLNLSELDGWWAEAYSPALGWSLGDGEEHGENEVWDSSEGHRLYDLLENEVIPLFYKRDTNDIPVEWLKLVRESMATLTSRFSANRSVREYTEKYYLPAAFAYRERCVSQNVEKIMAWKEKIRKNWDQIQIEEVLISSRTISLRIQLGVIDPSEVSVQIYADGEREKKHLPEIIFAQLIKQEKEGRCLFEAIIETQRPLSDYTPRIIPYFEGVKVPLEMHQIYWGQSLRD